MKGEMVDQLAYHEWPLFHNFRDSVEFQEAYEEIYSIPFIEKITEDVQSNSETPEGSQGNKETSKSTSSTVTTGKTSNNVSKIKLVKKTRMGSPNVSPEIVKSTKAATIKLVRKPQVLSSTKSSSKKTDGNSK